MVTRSMHSKSDGDSCRAFGSGTHLDIRSDVIAELPNTPARGSSDSHTRQVEWEPSEQWGVSTKRARERFASSLRSVFLSKVITVMRQKTKVQAMPGKKAAGIAKDNQINPGKAGPKGALADKPPGTGKAPSSGTRGAEGNNTRRDFVGGVRKLGSKKSR